MTDPKPYELETAIMDGSKVQGFVSNNLNLYQQPIQDYFSFTGSNNEKKVMPFDFEYMGMVINRDTTSSGQMDGTVEISRQDGTIIYEDSTVKKVRKDAEALKTVPLFPKGSTVTMRDYSNDPSLNINLTITAYFKRIKVTAL